MRQVDIRYRFALEFLLATAIFAITSYLASESSFWDYQRETCAELRHVFLYYLGAVAFWSTFFSMCRFLGSFSRWRKSKAARRDRIFILVMDTIEVCCWFVAVGFAAYESWYYQDMMGTTKWSLVTTVTAFTVAMLFLEFFNFVLACRDIDFMRIAAKLDPENSFDTESENSSDTTSENSSNTAS